MAPARAMVSIQSALYGTQRMGQIEEQERVATLFPPALEPPALELGGFESALGNQLYARDVEAVAGRIQSAGDFHLLPLVLPGSLLVVQLIDAVARNLQDIAHAVLYDRAREDLCGRGLC